MTTRQPLSITDAVPQREAETTGLAPLRAHSYWRSLEELAQNADFQEMIAREFPSQIEACTNPISRRRFLTLMAASLGLAGLSGCAQPQAPQERILPYVRPPESLVPGRPLYFATAMPFGEDALGLLAESHEGRPTKIEGNPDHPSNPKPPGSPAHARFGASDQFAQASILSLYDPDRSQAVTHLGDISSWDSFVRALRRQLGPRGAAQRTRLRVLTDSVASPTMAQQLRALTEHFPQAQWHVHEPVARDNVREGARLAFGENVQAQYRFGEADVVLMLDGDCLSEGPGHVRYQHDFALRRRLRRGQDQARMNRLYAVESMPSGIGAMADHRLPMRSSDIETFARALAAGLDERFRPLVPQNAAALPNAWIGALAQDLLRHRGTSLVLVGAHQPPFVHALAHTLNDFLGNNGRTVVYTAPTVATPPPSGTLRQLAEDMDAGLVDVLMVLGGNPVYSAPADLRFGERMSRVPFRVHLGLYADETADLCHWHVPQAHFLESWGDVRSHDGTVAIVQPLIAPLNGGRTALEMLAMLYEQPEQTGYEIVRAYWRTLFTPGHPHYQSLRREWESQGATTTAFTGNFDNWWNRALHDGLVAGTGLPPKPVALRREWGSQQAMPAASGPDLEIVFRPDPTIYDGRFANNGWLQELPKPLSKITWDNAAYISPATAVRLGFASSLERASEANGKVVELTYQGRTLDAPLWVLPGQADNSVTVHLGYGRTKAGRVGTNVGFNAYRLRTSSAPWFDRGLTLRLAGRDHNFASTQQHHLMENRDLVRSGTVQNPPHVPGVRHPLTLYNETEHHAVGNQWGMVIDLGVCTGCSSCVVACQAENNIPIVGKEEVRRGRAMHWLRVDHYHKGEPANPESYFQPVPCMHCENAPCEVVCPVGATVHSSDGLNDMVYNRCVGTRYCSNNCPYKVRRFNFFQYADFATQTARLRHNPDVTVRSRGVMEKCTYCVQRIRGAQIAAQLEDRPVRDGDVMTACQAACPSGAIVFGDLQDQISQVAQARAEPLNYGLLADLNTRPRTTYLAALKNPNLDMPPLDRG